MRLIHLLVAVFVVTLFLTPCTSFAEAPSSADAAVQKVVKTLINAIRYKKDDLAAKQLGFESMARLLLDKDWALLSSAQQQAFIADFEVLMRAISFNKGREIFQYLDAIIYNQTKINGHEAHCKTTVVIYRNLKKTEIPIEWVLKEEKGQFRIVDTITAGESTAAGIRADQIVPLLQEGGPQALLQALHKKVSGLKT